MKLREYLDKHPETVEIFERALDYERSHPDSALGFAWYDIHALPQVLNKLVAGALMRITMKTRTSTYYKLADSAEVERTLAEIRAGVQPERVEWAEEVSAGLFDVIVGYDDVKELIVRSLNSSRPSHFLFVGGPSSAKSTFLLELGRLFNSVYALGSSSTRAGLADLLLEHKPRILLIDELDKINIKDAAVLLSLMETGIVSETKYRRQRRERMDTWVFGACNRTDGMPPELLSRFAILHFPEYDEPTFREVVVRVLEMREGVNPQLAGYIADKCTKDLKTRDPRDAVRIGRVTKTRNDVDKVVETLAKYQA